MKTLTVGGIDYKVLKQTRAWTSDPEVLPASFNGWYIMLDDPDNNFSPNGEISVDGKVFDNVEITYFIRNDEINRITAHVTLCDPREEEVI